MLARIAVLIVLLLVLAGVVGYWWTLPETTSSAADRESVFEKTFTEVAFQDDSTSDQILEMARKELEQFREKWPNSPLPWNAQADFDFRTGDAEGAQAAWTKSLEFDRRNADAIFGLANLAFEAGRYDEAAALCESLGAEEGRNPRVPLLLADTYLNQNKPDLAALTLEQHIASERASVQALEMLGSAKMRLKKYDEAIEVLLAVLQFNPKSTKAHYELAQAYLRKSDREKANVHLDEFKRLEKEDSENTSLGAQRFVDREHAVSVSAQVLADMSVALRRLGDGEGGEDKMLRALKLQPDRLAWLQELQDLYQSQEKALETIDVLKRIAELEPEKVDHLLAIGGLYSQLEQAEPAVEYFRKAIALAPEDPRCLEAKKIIEQQLNE